MVPRRFVRLAIVDAVGRVHAHLTPPALEDQPTRASAQRILDVGPAEDVAKECARRRGIVGINQGVDAGDHQTEPLQAPRIILIPSTAIKKPLIAPAIEVRTLPDLAATGLAQAARAIYERSAKGFFWTLKHRIKHVRVS